MEHVTAQHGFDAAGIRESELHPEFAAAWGKRREALKEMRERVNELIDKVEALEARPAPAPFPFAGPSSPGA